MTTRRAFILSAAAAPALAPSSVGAAAPGAGAPPTAENPHLAGAQLFGDVKTYADMGEHRTGLFADQRTVAWLKADLDGLGFTTRAQPFDTVRQDIIEAVLVIDGQHLPVFPQWPVQQSPGGDVSAALTATPWGDGRALAGKIAITHMPRPRGGALYAPEVMTPLRQMLDGRPAALVIVTDGPTDGIIALNVRPGLPPFPCPVVLMAPMAARALASMPTGNATLRVHAVATPAQAHNVIATLGSGQGAAIVVSTPISGWFRCAGERGPGIAIWRAMARHVAAHRLPGRWVFAATSGHEIGGIGGKTFLADGAPAVDATKLWLHFGAGFATYAWRRTGDTLVRLGDGPDPSRYLTASTGARRDQLARLFAGQPSFETPALVSPSDTVGEAALWMREGYPDVVGFVAGHTFHHVPGDGPETTGPELLTPIAQACARLLEEAAVSR